MDAKARIYQPAKNAMQSGRAKTRFWVLEYTPKPKYIDPLMGWTGSTDTLGQVRMRFSSQGAAETFAKEQGIDYEVEKPHHRRFQRKSYSDNFRFNNVETYVPPAKVF